MTSKRKTGDDKALTTAAGSAGGALQQRDRECWVPVRGWGDAYLVEQGSGRVRSRDRAVIDTLGRVRYLQGVELATCGPHRWVTLSRRGRRRMFTTAQIQRMAAGAPW